jgi:hypothetical protein
MEWWGGGGTPTTKVPVQHCGGEEGGQTEFLKVHLQITDRKRRLSSGEGWPAANRLRKE